MQVENWYGQALRYFYGIEAEISEDAGREISHFGNRMYMLLIASMLASLLVSIVLQIDIVGDVTVLVVLIALAKQTALIQRLGLDKLVVKPSQLADARKTMFRRSLKEAGLAFLASLGISFWLWHTGIPQESGTPAETYFQIALPGTVILVTTISFLGQWLANRKKIKVLSD